MVYLYKIISFILGSIVTSILFYIAYIVYVCIAKCVKKV